MPGGGSGRRGAAAAAGGYAGQRRSERPRPGSHSLITADVTPPPPTPLEKRGGLPLLPAPDGLIRQQRVAGRLAAPVAAALSASFCPAPKRSLISFSAAQQDGTCLKPGGGVGARGASQRAPDLGAR